MNEKLGLGEAGGEDYQKLEEIIMSGMCLGALSGQMDQGIGFIWFSKYDSKTWSRFYKQGIKSLFF